MEINKEIRKILKNNGINEEGLLYLLAVFFEINYNKFEQVIINRVNNLKIFTRTIDTQTNFQNNKKSNIVWEYPLFGESTDLTSLITSYRELFINVDKSLRGDVPTISNKFKIFFKTYPQYSSDNILEATELYLNHCIENGIFIQNANYFIHKKTNPTGSKLLQWLEILTEENETKKLYGR